MPWRRDSVSDNPSDTLGREVMAVTSGGVRDGRGMCGGADESGLPQLMQPRPYHVRSEPRPCRNLRDVERLLKALALAHGRRQDTEHPDAGGAKLDAFDEQVRVADVERAWHGCLLAGRTHAIPAAAHGGPARALLPRRKECLWRGIRRDRIHRRGSGFTPAPLRNAVGDKDDVID